MAPYRPESPSHEWERGDNTCCRHEGGPWWTLRRVSSTPPADLEIIWPPSARWTVAVLLFVALVLIGWHAWLRLPEATRPSQFVNGDAPQIRSVRGAAPEEAAKLFRVDLNKADHAQLLQIPGVAESLARKIEAYRDANGGFRDVAELANVSGVGPTILARLKGHVTVDESLGIERAVEPQPRATAVRKAVDPSHPINMNSASVAELQRLPGIGPTLAGRIVAAQRHEAVSGCRRFAPRQWHRRQNTGKTQTLRHRRG